MSDPFGKEPPLIEADQLRSWIVEDDNDVLVVNKPGWVVCHPSKNGPMSSLAGAVREVCGIDTSHLVSRLDRETSGLVIFARHRKSARELQMAIQERRVQKAYLAILEGQVSETLRISQPLSPDRESPVAVKQKVGRCRGAQTAKTWIAPVTRTERYTFAAVLIETGRKHQIRAHAQHAGYPVVGDKLYGPDEQLYLEFIEHGWTENLERQLPMRRQALHAWEATFSLAEGERTFSAELPADMQTFWTDVARGALPDEATLRGSFTALAAQMEAHVVS